MKRAVVLIGTGGMGGLFICGFAAMLEAFSSDPQHGGQRRSMPARLEGALMHGGKGGIHLPAGAQTAVGRQ
ncbi:MAG TPA: hypothetical protein EYP90_08985 [Chromatiaceae bacterium]|nr:hypothetical protein [Chromatiaceae bacterium]